VRPRQSVHTPDRAKVQFCEEVGDICTVGVVNLVVLACVLRATTKKNRQLLRRKVHPPDKILATPVIKRALKL